MSYHPQGVHRFCKTLCDDALIEGYAEGFHDSDEQSRARSLMLPLFLYLRRF